MWRKVLDWMGIGRRHENKAGIPADTFIADMIRHRKPGETALVGELVVLDLAEARGRVGEKWPLVSRHVHLLVENLLSRRLRGNSTFFRCGEGVFAIVFADLSKEEAESACGKVAEEIMTYLFGQALADLSTEEETDGQQLAVHSEVFEIALDELEDAASPVEAIKAHVMQRVAERPAEQAQSGSVDSVLIHVERKFDAIVAKASEGNSPKLVQQLETLVSKLRALERSLYASRPVVTNREDASAGGTQWASIEPPASALSRLSALIERTETQLATLRTADGAAGSGGAGVDAGHEGDVQWLSLPEHKIDFGIDYLPLLDITAGVKGIFLCRLRFRIGGMSYDPAQLREMEEDDEVFIIADRLAMRHLVQTLAEEEGEAGPSVLVVTVHQTTLENLASRRSYVELISQLPIEQRRRIFVEIVLGPNWKTGRLPAWVEQLKPYSRGIFLRFPGEALPAAADLQGIDFSATRQRGAGALGIDLADRRLGDEESRFHALRRIAAVASEKGLRTYAINMSEPRALTLCRAAAIRYVSNEMAMPAVSHPGGVERMSVEELNSQTVQAQSA